MFKYIVQNFMFQEINDSRMLIADICGHNDTFL